MALQVVNCFENVSTLDNAGSPLVAWDPNGSPLTFTILSQPVDGMFVPAASPQGQLVRGLSGSLDFFVRPFYNLSIVAVNGLQVPLNATANVTLQLLWVNRAPVIPSAQILYVREFAPLGTIVGQINVSDRDTSAPILDAVTITIISQESTTAGDLAPFNVTSGGMFRVAGGTGAPVARLLYANKTSYSVVVSATDRFGGVTVATIIIQIVPVNQAPQFPSGSVSFFAASQLAQSVGVPLNTVVVDPNIQAGLPDSLTFAFTNASQNLQGVFAIDRTSGQITVVNPTASLFVTGMSYTLVSDRAVSLSERAEPTVVDAHFLRCRQSMCLTPDCLVAPCCGPWATSLSKSSILELPPGVILRHFLLQSGVRPGPPSAK